MTYTVNEIFYTLQGEGANTGRAAVFCRFVGCNLWTGREQDREDAICRFCDTDFVGTGGTLGGKYPDPAALADAIAGCWPASAGGTPLVVCTGGEPLLQLDAPLLDALHAKGFAVAVETNGSLPVPDGVDWVCVSPKQGAPLVVTRGDELKVVLPQPGQDWDALEALDFRFHYVQPMAGAALAANTALAIAHCRARPRWRLSLQTHKLLGIR